MSENLTPGGSVSIPSKEKFHLFFLAGQSNMAGRGYVEDEDRVPHPRVLMQTRDGSWVPAVDPVHYDKKEAGVCLAHTFALELVARDEDITVGLVPTACGGSPISTWEPGAYHSQTDSHPYDDSIKRMRRAMEDGVLKAMLWHQGESDCTPELSAVYKSELLDLIGRFKNEFGAPDLPVVIGQLGEIPEAPWSESRRLVNRAHMEIVAELADACFVRSDGLTCNPDNIHFDAKSLREFGRRYAKAYLDMIG
ncbi:MAG: sialate O-acetylesterase [Planctomycetes bacterium]|nr:sialate O-acetylesterase [Planctomycetota bacterium]